MSNEKKPYLMTVSDLRDELNKLPPDAVFYFGNGDLNFYRFKPRGDNHLFQLEFNQVYTVNIDPYDEQGVVLGALP